MTESVRIEEGYAPFRGFRTWYRIVGEREQPGRLPLLALHGGPSLAYDYLEPLEAVATTGRRVIFYDQLGSGNSATPADPSLWTVDLFVDEIANLRRVLELDRVHVFGHSWGGMLAMEYALTQPLGLTSLVLSDTMASVRQWWDELRRLQSELPVEVQQVLHQHEAGERVDDAAYQQAMQVFERRHVVRIEPPPECYSRAMMVFAEHPEVFTTLLGQESGDVTGTLRDWNVVGRLAEIRVPTLVLMGQHGHVTPACCGTIRQGIPDAQWAVLENGGHFPFYEEPERYLQILATFLTSVEEGG